MFGLSQNIFYMKALKDANFLSVWIYAYKCVSIMLAEADVPKPIGVWWVKVDQK